MDPIITLTLSPALDLHCQCDTFRPWGESLATPISHDVGGKGVNISRALTGHGIPNLALLLLGEENAATFEKGLCNERIAYRAIRLPGRIRENLTLHTANAPETRISFCGFSADESVLEPLERMLEEAVGNAEGFYLTVTGRVPDGISVPSLNRLLARMQARGARIVIDSRSFTRKDLLALRPWLIKPNEEEIALYTDRAVQAEADAVDAILALQRAGIGHVILSRGAEGALMADGSGVWRANVPAITPVSTVGAGDSFLAGFLSAHRESGDAALALARAAAFGTAACLTEGTNPPLVEDVSRLLDEITITSLGNMI